MNGGPLSQVFDLYTSRAMLKANLPAEETLQRIIGLSGSSSATQLGLVDAKHDVIRLRFPTNADEPHDRSEDEVEISLAQDLSGLRSRKGNTGEPPIFFRKARMNNLVRGRGWVMENKVFNSPSIFRSLGTDSNESALFANSLVQARLAGSGSGAKAVHLLDFSLLRNARVMELGAGTGLLGLILAPLVNFYTFTDLPEHCRLIEKNININIDLLVRPPPPHKSSPTRRKKTKSYDESKTSDRRPANIAVEPLDWVALYDTPSHSRARLFPVPDPPTDLILATDTIYNPALVSPFLATLNHYAADQARTVVFIVMELRDEDVTREFLHQWINLEGWRIWRTDGAAASEADIVGLSNIPAARRLLDERFASWVAWKE